MGVFSTDLSSQDSIGFICDLIIQFNTCEKNEGALDSIDDLDYNDTFNALTYEEETVRLINSFLLKSLKANDIYFFDCSFSFYKITYEKRKEQFLNDHEGSIELDFLIEEEFILCNPNKFRILNSTYGVINYSKFLLRSIDFEIALNYKRDYIKSRLKLLQNKRLYNSEIFRSSKSEEWFNDTLMELNALREGMKSGTNFQGKCEAVFYNDYCKELIFVYDLYLKDFIKFLNREYCAGIKYLDKLSSGAKHVDEVSKLINLHKKSRLPNSSE